MPKTIDNDLAETDQTFGFDTAVSVISDALDRLHSTAEAHHRVMIVETMGRHAGWLALAGGLAGGGDIILIPEIPYKIEKVRHALEKRDALGKTYTIIVVAEGAVQQSPGAGQKLADEIETATGKECRAVVLGHLQRGGTPTAFDRLLGTRFGVKAVELAIQGKFGEMACLRGNAVESIPISKVSHQIRTVPLDHPLILTARSVGTAFGD